MWYDHVLKKNVNRKYIIELIKQFMVLDFPDNSKYLLSKISPIKANFHLPLGIETWVRGYFLSIPIIIGTQTTRSSPSILRCREPWSLSSRETLVFWSHSLLEKCPCRNSNASATFISLIYHQGDLGSKYFIWTPFQNISWYFIQPRESCLPTLWLSRDIFLKALPSDWALIS